jgi:hypothetical protein
MGEGTFATALLGPAVAAAALTAAATFLANIILSVRDDARRRRGLAVALRAEITERRRAQQAFLDGTDVAAVKAQIDGDPDYVPFTTSDPDFSRALYNDLRADVSVLDSASLDAVVRFYVEDNLTQCMVIDLRSDLFRKLAGARKKSYLDLLVAQARETVEAGTAALDSLEASFRSRRIRQSG